MRFAHPIWLVIGALTVVVVFALLARAERKRTRAIALLTGARLLPAHAALPSCARRWLRVAVATFAVAMGFGALARPQKGMHWETMERNGIDLLLVVDTSKSMDADDVKPTRLERAKLAIRDLVERLPGDRVGLVAFAGDAILESPLTLDHAALLETVDALDTSIVGRGGTDIGRAIDVGTAALATEPGHQKAMVILSDGEDLEAHGLEEAQRAAGDGIVIDTVGVGSAAGELVPSRDEQGRIVGVARDEAGNPVRSHLDEAGMTAIANAAHGTYRPLGADGRGLDRLYQESLAARAHIEASSRTRRVYSEWFEVPLGLALAALVLDALLGLPWRRVRGPSRRVAPPALAAAAALLLLFVPVAARASVSGAAKAYAAGRFDEAAQQYEAESAKHPHDARLAFNAGDAAYRAKHYDAAAAAFKRALGAADPKLQQHALYNQGDALYREGETHVADARPQTIEQWKAAIAAYDGALALNPADADARFNRDFVKRKLAELEEKQKKDDDQRKQEPPKQGDKSDSKKDAKGGGGSQDAQAKGGGKGQDGKDEAKADQGGAQGKDATQGPKIAQNTPSPSNGAGSPAQGQNGAQNQPAPHAGKGTEPGQLSPRDARALLGALRGEERHGAVRGADAGAATDDSPRKDW